jgi:hypothetical protein
MSMVSCRREKVESLALHICKWQKEWYRRLLRGEMLLAACFETYKMA